jgi:hypothetical protein
VGPVGEWVVVGGGGGERQLLQSSSTLPGPKANGFSVDRKPKKPTSSASFILRTSNKSLSRASRSKKETFFEAETKPTKLNPVSNAQERVVATL